MIIDVEQGSPDWFQMRHGCATGSRFHEAVDRVYVGKKNEAYSASREKYKWNLITERLTGMTTENFDTAAMQWGREHEETAAEKYAMVMDAEIEPGGLAQHDSIKWFCASIDRRIGTKGGLEIKCPTSRKHLEYIKGGCVPEEHIEQMKSEMACYQLDWVDFVSFDPRMPKDMRMFIRRLERDESMIIKMEEHVRIFLAEVDDEMKALRKQRGTLLLPTLSEQLHASLGVGESVAETA